MEAFQAIFESSPDAYLILRADADFTIEAVNDAYLRATMTTREAIIGRPIFEIFPDNPDTPEALSVDTLRKSLETAVATGQRHEIPPLRYDIPRAPHQGGGFERRHWRACNIPVLDAKRRVTHVIHRVEDVTDWVRLQEAERSQRSSNETLRSRAHAASQELARRTDELEQTHRELSEQRHALHEARTRLEAAIFSGYVATWIWELSIDEIHGDDSLARWFRLAPDEPAPTSFDTYLERIHPDDAPLVRQRVEASLASNQSGEVEYRIVRGETPRRVLARWRVDRNAEGQPVRLAGVLLDVSELRTATETLAQVREQLDLAAEAAGLGTFSWELPDGRLTWNERLKQQFFLPPDAPIDIGTFYARVHPDDRTHVREAVERAIRQAAHYDVEFRAVAPDGSFRWLHASGQAFPATTTQPAHFEGISLDVSRQKQIESKLRESEARYRLVIDNLPDYAIFLLDDDGLVTHWNAGAQRLLGYTADEILGRSVDLLFTPEDRARDVPAKERATAKATGRGRAPAGGGE